MYSEAWWPDLAASLTDAEDGKLDGILRMADSITGREPDGTYQNIAESGPVIRCASGIVQETPDDPEELLADLRGIAPRFSLDIRVDELRDLCDEMLDDPADAIVPSYDGWCAGCRGADAWAPEADAQDACASRALARRCSRMKSSVIASSG